MFKLILVFRSTNGVSSVALKALEVGNYPSFESAQKAGEAAVASAGEGCAVTVSCVIVPCSEDFKLVGEMVQTETGFVASTSSRRDAVICDQCDGLGRIFREQPYEHYSVCINCLGKGSL